MRGLVLALMLGLAGCGAAGWPPAGGDAEAAVEVLQEAPGGEPAPESSEPGESGEPEPEIQPEPLAEPPPPEPPPLAAERLACQRQGGTLQPRAGGLLACVRSTRDAGRACAAADQCQGDCLARSGTCAPLTPLYGCHEVLLAGGARVTQCLE